MYNDKTATDDPQDEQSQTAYFGSLLEDVVAREFATRTSMKLQRVTRILRSGEGDWMIANIDRAIVQNDIAGRVYVYDEQRQAETAGEGPAIFINELNGALLIRDSVQLTRRFSVDRRIINAAYEEWCRFGHLDGKLFERNYQAALSRLGSMVTALEKRNANR